MVYTRLLENQLYLLIVSNTSNTTTATGPKTPPSHGSSPVVSLSLRICERGNEVRRAAAAPSLDGRVAGAPVRCWNSSCHGGGTCGPALVDCGCGIGYEAGFGAGFGAGCGSRSRSAVVARQLQRRGRAGSGTATSAAREGAATGATLAAVRRARRSLGRGPTRAEAPADDEKARGRGPRGRVGCCRARDRGLRARTAGTAWGGAWRTSHSHRGTIIRAHSGHYRIAARRGQHTVRGRRTSCRQQQNALFCVWPYFLQPGVWPTRSQRMYSGRFHELVTWHKSVPAGT